MSDLACMYAPSAEHCGCWRTFQDVCCRCGESYAADRREERSPHQPAPSASLTPADAGSVGTSFVVPGKAVGKGRPRMGRGRRVYTPQATIDAEGRVRAAWVAAGAVRLEGPLAILLAVAHGRPPSHLLKHSRLSAAGRRAGAVPTVKPDLDNVLKLVADALNGHAYHDDAQIVRAVVTRRWALPGEEQPHVYVHLTQETA